MKGFTSATEPATTVVTNIPAPAGRKRQSEQNEDEQVLVRVFEYNLHRDTYACISLAILGSVDILEGGKNLKGLFEGADFGD